MDDIMKEIREKAIRNAYFDALKSLMGKSAYISTEEIIKGLVNKTAPRFFITYDNARRIVSLMHRGKSLPITNKKKLEMYQELYRRYVIYKNEFKVSGYCILEKIIEEPAPSYYITEQTMRGIVYKTFRKK